MMYLAAHLFINHDNFEVDRLVAILDEQNRPFDREAALYGNCRNDLAGSAPDRNPDGLNFSKTFPFDQDFYFISPLFRVLHLRSYSDPGRRLLPS
jgi:hypothetical protein